MNTFENLALRKYGLNHIAASWYRGETTAIDEAALRWSEFKDLPLGTKNIFTASDTREGIGYEFKSAGTGTFDVKQNFDYVRGSDDTLFMKLHEVEDKEEFMIAARFIQSAKALGDKAVTLADRYHGKYAHTDKMSGMRVPYTRFIHYPAGGEVGDVIANPHVDRSAYTLHLYESTSGCEYLKRDLTWAAFPRHLGIAAFHGLQGQYASRNERKALWHRVVANEETVRLGRKSIVNFVKYDMLATYHGRTQDLMQGSTYFMGRDQIDELIEPGYDTC